MPCTDPAVAFLARLGFNIVRLPRAGLEPLHMIGGDRHGLRPLQAISDFVVSDNDWPPPQIHWDEPAATSGIRSVRSVQMRAGIGLAPLATFALPLGVDAKALYKRARRFSFGFDEARIDRVAPGELDAYVAALDVRNGSLMQDYLPRQLYLLDSVIKARTLTVELVNVSSIAAALDTETLEALPSGSISTKLGKDGTLTVSHTSDVDLVFGFTCFRLYIGSDGNLGLKHVPPGAAAYAATSGDHVVLLDPELDLVDLLDS